MSQKNKGIKVNHILLKKDKFQIRKSNIDTSDYIHTPEFLNTIIFFRNSESQAKIKNWSTCNVA
jgi:hypothetical protein